MENDISEIEKICEQIKNELVSGATTFKAQIARRSEYRAKAAETTGQERSNWLFRAEVVDAAMEDARNEMLRTGKIHLGQQVP